MRILVTGISGYLGSQLANELSQDNELAGTIRNSSSFERINDASMINFINVESNNWKDDIECFSPEIIINTVASYGRNNERFSEIVHSNIFFPLEIADIVSEQSDAVFINCGTCLPRNISDYSLTKNQFSEILRSMTLRSKFRVIDLKLEHFYGAKDDDSKFTSMIINKCINGEELKLTTGIQQRDFIYIKDLISAIKIITDNIDCFHRYEIVPIGTGNAIPVKKFVEGVAEVTKSTSHLLFGAIEARKNEVQYSCADISRLKQLGWAPKFSLRTAIVDIMNENMQ